MKKKLCLYVFLFFNFYTLTAAPDLNFATSLVNDSLKTNAVATVRLDETELQIHSINKVTCIHRFAITVWNAKGNDYAVIDEYYNNLIKINNIKGSIYNAEGKIVSTIKDKDLIDKSTFGTTVSFHDDSRIKYFKYYPSSYPYTIYYEVTSQFKTTFFLPGWSPKARYNLSVEQSNFTLSYPTAMDIVYKSYDMEDASFFNLKQSTVGEDTKIMWSAKNLAATPYEAKVAYKYYEQPLLRIKANNFEVYNYKGNADSWNNFGAFIYNLNKDKDQLPEDKIKIAQNLTASLNHTSDKIAAIYHYVQRNTRYVANTYGIASWQTFDANSVAKYGYGDCKGLTNYTMSLLKAIGINAYTALISANEQLPNYFDKDFPNNNFNHVILCIPNDKDSIWLECTSTYNNSGYLGAFTQNRPALLITENGGFLIQTPNYNDANISYVVTQATLNILPENANNIQGVQFQNTYSGTFQDDIMPLLKTNTEGKIKEHVQQKFNFPSYTVDSFTLSNHVNSNNIPSVTEKVSLQAKGIINYTNKRIFITPKWLENPIRNITQTHQRVNKIRNAQDFQYIDSIIINYPVTYGIESLHPDIEIKDQNGNFEYRTVNNNEGQLIIIRTYRQIAGSYDASLYPKFVALYQAFEQSKTWGIVLSK